MQLNRHEPLRLFFSDTTNQTLRRGIPTFPKSKGAQTPVVDASSSFGCCSSSVYSSDQISRFQSLFDQEPYIRFDWTLSQSPENDGTIPFDGVGSSGTPQLCYEFSHHSPLLFRRLTFLSCRVECERLVDSLAFDHHPTSNLHQSVSLLI